METASGFPKTILWGKDGEFGTFEIAKIDAGYKISLTPTPIISTLQPKWKDKVGLTTIPNDSIEAAASQISKFSASADSAAAVLNDAAQTTLEDAPHIPNFPLYDIGQSIARDIREQRGQEWTRISLPNGSLDPDFVISVRNNQKTALAAALDDSHTGEEVQIALAFKSEKDATKFEREWKKGAGQRWRVDAAPEKSRWKGFGWFRGKEDRSATSTFEVPVAILSVDHFFGDRLTELESSIRSVSGAVKLPVEKIKTAVSKRKTLVQSLDVPEPERPTVMTAAEPEAKAKPPTQGKPDWEQKFSAAKAAKTNQPAKTSETSDDDLVRF